MLSRRNWFITTSKLTVRNKRYLSLCRIHCALNNVGNHNNLKASLLYNRTTLTMPQCSCGFGVILHVTSACSAFYSRAPQKQVIWLSCSLHVLYFIQVIPIHLFLPHLELVLLWRHWIHFCWSDKCGYFVAKLRVVWGEKSSHATGSHDLQFITETAVAVGQWLPSQGS